MLWVGVMMIIVGVFTIALAIFRWFAAMYKNRIVLYLYVILMILIILLEFAVIIVTWINENCDSPSNRTEYMLELMHLANVEIPNGINHPLHPPQKC